MKELLLLTFVYMTSVVTLDVCKGIYYALKLQSYRYVVLVVLLYVTYLIFATVTLRMFVY
jgi:hypothetical protein